MYRLFVIGLLVGSFSVQASAQAFEFYEAFPAYVGGRVSNDPEVYELCKWKNIFLGPISERDFAVMRYVPVESYDGQSVRCFQKRIADLLTCADAFRYARARSPKNELPALD